MLPRLKELRNEYGISQQKLAELLGITQPSINKYENHDIEPEFYILKKMADYFETSVDYLIGCTDIRRKIEPVNYFDLNTDEEDIITLYRKLNKKQKECIRQTLNTFLSDD